MRVTIYTSNNLATNLFTHHLFILPVTLPSNFATNWNSLPYYFSLVHIKLSTTIPLPTHLSFDSQ